MAFSESNIFDLRIKNSRPICIGNALFFRVNLVCSPISLTFLRGWMAVNIEIPIIVNVSYYELFSFLLISPQQLSFFLFRFAHNIFHCNIHNYFELLDVFFHISDKFYLIQLYWFLDFLQSLSQNKPIFPISLTFLREWMCGGVEIWIVIRVFWIKI